MILKKDTLVAQIVSDMDNQITTDASRQLRDVIYRRLHDYEIKSVERTLVKTEDVTDTAKAIRMFFVSKKIEGLTERSLNYYKTILRKFFNQCHKDIKNITTDDIRYYLAILMSDKKASKVTCDNERRVLSSFFGWCADEDYIHKSPVKRIKKIKQAKLIKQPFTDDELERIRDACTNDRDRAIVDVLASTGMRVGEMERLNKNDVNLDTGEIKVFGKGEKERITFLNAKAKLHLRRYLESRKDSSNALFVGINNLGKRLRHGGIEVRLQQIGRAAGVENVHPHRFRRTAATQAINRGMPIEQVQIMLGHEQIQTTTMYAIVNQKNVKVSHEKYLS